MITDTDVAAYDRDGVVCLRQAFDPAWVERLRAAVERDLATPGPNATNFAEGSTAGRFFGDMFMWQHDASSALARRTAGCRCAIPATTRATIRGPARSSFRTSPTLRPARR